MGAARGRLGGVPLAWVCGVRGRALSHPRPPVNSGVRPGPATHSLWVRSTGLGVRLFLAPSPVPRFVVCCARFLSSRHPLAVVAWHLSLCHGCYRRRASLACLEAPRWCAAPRPVRSLLVLQSPFTSPLCLPPPEGLSPRALIGGCAGHMEAGRKARLIVPAAGRCRDKGAERSGGNEIKKSRNKLYEKMKSLISYETGKKIAHFMENTLFSEEMRNWNPN